MEADLPLLGHDRIIRAAEGMISNHGKNALAEAVRRARILRSAGCDSAAAAWESICEIIRVRIGGSALVESTVAAKLSQPDRLRGAEATLKASIFERP